MHNAVHEKLAQDHQCCCCLPQNNRKTQKCNTPFSGYIPWIKSRKTGTILIQSQWYNRSGHVQTAKKLLRNLLIGSSSIPWITVKKEVGQFCNGEMKKQKRHIPWLTGRKELNYVLIMVYQSDAPISNGNCKLSFVIWIQIIPTLFFGLRRGLARMNHQRRNQTECVM